MDFNLNYAPLPSPFPPNLTYPPWGEHLTRCARRGDVALWPYQTAAASAPGAPCLGVLSIVHDTLELNYCTKLFHQTVHALSARSCKTRHYTNVVCCSLKIPPLKLSPGTR